MRTFLRLAAVLMCSVAPVYGQSMAQAELTFLPWKAELFEAKDFWETLTAARKEEDKRKITGTISAGFNGDQANGDSLFKLKTGAALSRSAYPSELRFSADVSMQVKGKEFQEDVTTLLANYDYNHYRYAQYYAFVERFTDSFLSIDQRYETGFGAMFGLHLGGLRAKALELDTKLAALTIDPATSSPMTGSKVPGIPAVETAALRGRTALTPDDYKNLATAVRRLRDTLATKESRYFLGIAISAFSELELAKIETTTASGVKKSFTLDPTHKFRFTIRPTVIARPADQLEVTFYPYLKYPLEGPWKIGDKVDYRFDLISTTTWTLEKDTTGNENVAFTFKFERRHDNVPPQVPASSVDAAKAAGDPLLLEAAHKTHYSTGISLTVKW